MRDAVTISAPAGSDGEKRTVVFESKDAAGKRLVHATRFDAQMHVIHSRLSSFTHDPDSPEYPEWKAKFDVESRTDAIARDLEKADELRRAMDKLVPEQVSYPDFWARYYYLRHLIEIEEQNRRDLLKGTQEPEEEVAWDDDEDEEDHAPIPNVTAVIPPAEIEQAEAGATTPTSHEPAPDMALLRPTNEPRRSNEHSVADSDASYDMVSGAPSRDPESPKEERGQAESKRSGIAVAPSDTEEEEDWE